MTTLREAAQQALEAMEDHAKQYPHMQKGYTVDAITALRAALAQQAEPVVGVVWSVDWGRDGDRACASIVKKRADGSAEIVAVEYAPYTAPPQRKPLTEEEIEACRQQGYDHDGLHSPFDFREAARAIERAHGIHKP